MHAGTVIIRKLQTTTVCTGTKFFTVQMKEPKCSKMSHLILLSLALRACDVPNANMVKQSFSRQLHGEKKE